MIFKLRHALALVIGLCWVSCTSCAPPDPPLEFYVGPELSQDEVQILHHAAERWNAKTVPWRKITFTDTWGIDQIRLGDLSDTEEGETVYTTSHTFTRVTIKPGLDPHRFLQVATHELGHTLELQHVPEGEGIMAPDGITPTDDITEKDVAECARVGSCYTP